MKTNLQYPNEGNAIKNIDLYFTSGNTIPIERATIKREEWEAVKLILERRYEHTRLLEHHVHKMKMKLASMAIGFAEYVEFTKKKYEPHLVPCPINPQTEYPK